MFDALSDKHGSNTAGASRHHKGALALYNAGTVGCLQEKEKSCLLVVAVASVMCAPPADNQELGIKSLCLTASVVSAGRSTCAPLLPRGSGTMMLSAYGWNLQAGQAHCRVLSILLMGAGQLQEVRLLLAVSAASCKSRTHSGNEAKPSGSQSSGICTAQGECHEQKKPCQRATRLACTVAQSARQL